MDGKVYVFGPWRYDSGQRVLFRGAERVALLPKAVEILAVLLEQHGRVVEKAVLLKRGWPDTVVEEIGLARNVSLLRKVLGETVDGHAYIETVPKRGYRFVAAVMVEGDGDEARRAAPVRRRRRIVWIVGAAVALVAIALIFNWQVRTPSRYVARTGDSADLAVVPFDCVSGQLDETWCRSFGELLVADLSQLHEVHVTSPATVRRFERLKLIDAGLMGRILALDVLVEGSAARIGDRVRITARLVDVHTGKVIWSDSYERPAAGAGAAQPEIARAIAAQVGAHLSINNRFRLDPR